MGLRGVLVLGFALVVSVAAATARAGENCGWKDSAMTALFANAEAVLEARQMVSSGRPIFTAVDHRVVSETPGGTKGSAYPVLVEEYVFEVAASFGDAIGRVGTLTITETTTRYPRSPSVEYSAKVEPLPTGTILPSPKK